MILDFTYIRRPCITGDLKTDVVNLLNENNKNKTAAHCIEVAETCSKLAKRFDLNEEIAYISGLLHDVSAVIKPDDMMKYAENHEWNIYDSERRYNFILHQRISKIIAGDYFGISNKDALSAIECHSTLKANASNYDIVLFLADKISWDQEGEPPFLEVIHNALNISLPFAAYSYVNFVLQNNMILLPHKWLIQANKWLEERYANKI